MIDVQQATETIFAHLYVAEKISVPVSQAIGKILAEPIVADRDLPPFNRVTMDGIAISYKTWKEGRRTYYLEKMQAAGQQITHLSRLENAIEVMTGAVLPANTDTVIRYEDVSIEGGSAHVTVKEIIAGQSVHLKGSDATAGEVLLEPGLKISSAEIALLASVGKSHVLVFQYPATAIIGSGDELVPVDAMPLSHQVRRSNTYALQSAMMQMGWASTQYHLPDQADVLQQRLSVLLNENDVLILSGGVSKGKHDYIPAVLEKLGVKKMFHEVLQRPGKPMWFGVKGEKRIFALPGNPVSTYMCFYRYVKPWMLRSLSFREKPQYAVLAKDFVFAPKLTYFLQVRVENEAGRLLAYPDQGGGSGDFANLKKIDGFLELPAAKTDFKAGEVFPFIPFRL